MGQGILKRMAGEPAAVAASEYPGSGGTTQAPTSPRQGLRLSWGQQQQQQQQEPPRPPLVAPARSHSFRLWPAPTELALQSQAAAADGSTQNAPGSVASAAARQLRRSSLSQQGQLGGGSSALEGELAATAAHVLAEVERLFAMLSLLLADGC
jgi:hypothetical protein